LSFRSIKIKINRYFQIMTLKNFKDKIIDLDRSETMPALFIGHGSPMNALEDNNFTRGWKELGKKLPKPKVILVISAHWLTEGTFVHEAVRPKTIHDFWGFPEELYKINYDCPGAPDMARETKSIITKTSVGSDLNWGIDHGTWVPLLRLFPDADIPTFQMSIDVSKSEEAHYEIGRELAELRQRGVLIIGSGNIVHNLGRVSYDPDTKPLDWAVEFDEISKDLILKGDHQSLINHDKLGTAAKLSIPTPDHYWPLIYTLAVQKNDEPITFPINGIAHGSVSMRTVAIGL
jgi:4,5-DOPA dioxygenase extradiol